MYVCVCVCAYIYIHMYVVVFFFTVILPRFKLHLSVEKLKCDTMMPTFPPLQFYEIIVTQYQLRLTDALGGRFCNGKLRGLGPKICLCNSCPGLLGLLIWKCAPWGWCMWRRPNLNNKPQVKGMCAFRKYFINADNLSILIKPKEMTHIIRL